MKIAYVVEKFPLISETFVLAQIVGMIERGHDVRIFARRRADVRKVHPNVSRYQLVDKTTFAPRPPAVFAKRILPALAALRDAAGSGNLRAAFRALNPVQNGREAASLKLLLHAAPFFRQDGFDVIHCQFGHLGVEIAAIQKCGLIPGRLVTSFRGTDAMKVASRNPTRFRPLFHHDGDVLCVSNAVRDRLISLGCPARKAEVLRSGVDIERFAFRGAQPMHDPLRLLSVGRLAPNKGLEYAISATRMLIDEGQPVEYCLIGDGPSREALEAQAATLGIDHAVRFMGAVDADDVASALLRSDVLLTPSVTGREGEQEGLPNAPKEAMSIGVPVIATGIGGIPELVVHDKTGFLVDEKDAASIADCVRRVVRQWDGLGPLLTAARDAIEREFEINALNDRLEAKYRGLAGAA